MTQNIRLASGALALSVMVLLAGGVFAQSQPAATTESEPVIDPGAITALNEMGAFLRAQKMLTVRADIVRDEVLVNGQKLQFGATVDLWARRPNRLRVDMESDRKTRQLYYNGKTFTVYGPRNGYYATVNAPATNIEVIEMVEERYGVDFPLDDLFYWGTEQSGRAAIKEAKFVGPATIAGAKTDHYAFRQKDVDWQIWIEQGDKPFPRKLVITTLDEEGAPQYTAVLSWKTPDKISDAQFEFVPDKKAHRIELVELAGKGR